MIYVDALMPCIRNARWQHDESCHLMCDVGELDQLHAFAQSIGLKRSWFQKKPTSTPHYDLTAGMRAKAVRAGAVELGREGTVKIIRAWRESRTQPEVQTMLL